MDEDVVGDVRVDLDGDRVSEGVGADRMRVVKGVTNSQSTTFVSAQPVVAGAVQGRPMLSCVARDVLDDVYCPYHFLSAIGFC